MGRSVRKWTGVLLGAWTLLGPDSGVASELEQRAIDGLRAPAEILIDPWGIAHIYAANESDAFFLQGYNAARDRLWQIDLWRKRGLGLLARDFGPAYVEQDRAARLFLYRGDMATEWRAYGADAQARTQAFVAGINAFVSEIERGVRALPPEFEIADTRPDHWRPEDVVRIRSHAIALNAMSEFVRARIACAGALEQDRYRWRLQPAHDPKIAEGLDPCAIPADVMRDYFLAVREVKFAGASSAPQGGSQGSNNWVVNGTRSATGRPLLANDPHRPINFPSLRYIVHLNAPGMSVIGAGEPALPGISIGHNGHVAFGLTVLPIDQEDLYVYTLDPRDPLAYRYEDGWERMRTHIERIEVRGEAAREATLHFTRHGPVLKYDSASGRAFALRTVWTEPGTSAYFGSMRYMTAKSAGAFVQAMRHWRVPGENMVYADRSGDIGWVAGGSVPRRPNWDGLTPVPGGGRYEWAGFLPPGALPEIANPSQGWWATANEMVLPAGYPRARKISYEWLPPYRGERIRALLAENRKLSVADMLQIQADTYNRSADVLLPLIASVQRDDAMPAVRLLRAWDRHADTHSSGAALFEIWTARHLGPALVQAKAPPAAHALFATAMLDALARGVGELPSAELQKIIADSLAAAWADAVERMGHDSSKWRWGDLHQLRLRHALAGLQPNDDRLAFPAIAAPGGPHTVNANAYGADFSVIAGASFRIVVDVGEWDQSVAVNAPGQSGQPGHPHAGDHVVHWARGAAFPLLFTREAIERITTRRILLRPAGSHTSLPTLPLTSTY